MPELQTLVEPAPVAVADSGPPPSIVLVGCGAVARLFYQPALAELVRRHELQVAAVVDPVSAARATLAGRFPRAGSSAGLEDVTAPAGSLAIIASPPRLHAAHATAALARGWHVLCEKPMAASPAECEGMIRTAAEARRLLAVGFYKRFFPSSAMLRRLCRDGGLGALRAVSIHEGGPFDWPAASPSFFVRRETPGGVLLDIGVHVFDLLRWWLGEPARLDYWDDAMGGLETNAVVHLHYAGGVKARVQLSRDWTTRQAYEFVFERGTVKWTVNDANGLAVHLNGVDHSLQGRLVDDAGLPAYTNAQCFIAQLQNVLAAIRGAEPLRAAGEDGLHVARLVESCYVRRLPLPQPWLEPAEEKRARQLAELP